ncbi:helix-turn-helix transcriptional regulator [Lentzea sp. NBRC 102530]|uniref:helix-turn-helix domain-containing protein n=1 Tax=Lentzea sp. NBRC 102530 TaxID=3032201 RepID=UPI0024A0865D|nr:helix-turn-helix transcriptional regulator [Lentzea sp. NBRC 102530]GLY54803.1 transcriptional regulator [Lentzea sp. NBRC 102530]
MQLFDDQFDNAFGVELGRLIRSERKSRRWTRKQLRAAMFPELDDDAQAAALSLQTLATWELGTRKITAAKLVHVCTALGVSAGDLVGRAVEHLIPAANGPILLNRAGLSASTDPRLHQLKQWVAAQSPPPEPGKPQSPVVELPRDALVPLANLTRIPTSELTSALTELVIDRS